MERISLQSDRKAIIAEHTHRYKLSSILAKGNVLDVSCGIGYGSMIICESAAVSSYMGVDISEKEIKYANENFKSPKTEFRQGDICSLQFPDNSFDTIVSLETLEHIPDPKSALKELARVLKEDGLLIGSVPEKSYDEKCERIYGPNPYHLHKFTREEIKNLLNENFKEVEIKVVGFMLGSQVEGSNYKSTEILNKIPEGSFLFLASKTTLNISEIGEKISGLFLPALSMLEYDEEQSYPLRIALQNQKELIEEKDKAMISMDLLIKERDEAILKMTEMIDSRDQAIKRMEEILEKRWAIIQEYDAKVKLLEGIE